jgi:hypothetical protein
MLASHDQAKSTGARRFDVASRSAADWLSLAAAPSFAVMALLTVILSDAQANTSSCLGMATSPLMGMAPMYLLMSAFHAAPWLRLLLSR